MVELPGNLDRATLGDVLGALHRERISGALYLTEVGGDGHQHVIHWHDGLIHHVESTRAASVRLGALPELTLAARWMRADGGELARLSRLEALFRLSQARLSFRVMGRLAPPSARPLGPEEFLHGRRRKRDSETPRAPATTPPRQLALRTLGLSGEPDAGAVRAAFRRLARSWHPDLHPNANERTRAYLCQRFVEISNAYRELTAGA